MGKVIRSDLYRLFRQRSFYVVMVLAALINALDGPLTKTLFGLPTMLADGDEETLAELGEFMSVFRFSAILRTPLGRIDTVLVLLLVTWFAYADLSHGYIKNIAGQLSKKGNIILSKLAVTGFIITVMMLIGAAGQTVGYLTVVEVNFTDHITDALIIFCVKWVCLLAVCSILLLVVAALHSQTGGAVISVVMGAGFTSLMYMGISAGIRRLFKVSFEIEEYMPDEVFHSELTASGGAIDTELLIKGLVTAVLFIIVFASLAVSMFSKRDVS